MRRGDDFNRVAATVAEFLEQPAHVLARHRITARMRKDRLPAGPGDPAKRLRERCPRVRNITWLSAHEIALERVMHVAHITRLCEKTREVRTRNEPFAGHVLTGACERVRYAGVLKRVGDLLRSSVAPRPNRCETFTQRLIFGIDAQCEDVQRVFFP